MKDLPCPASADSIAEHADTFLNMMHHTSVLGIVIYQREWTCQIP